MCITGIVKVRAILNKLFFKIIVSFDVLATRKEVLSGSGHRMETHLDVVVEIIEVPISVSFSYILMRIS